MAAGGGAEGVGSRHVRRVDGEARVSYAARVLAARVCGALLRRGGAERGVRGPDGRQTRGGSFSATDLLRETGLLRVRGDSVLACGWARRRWTSAGRVC